MIQQFLDLYRTKDKLVGAMPEPQWRMLLTLLGERRALRTTSLCLAAGTPMTTGLRHIGALAEEGWIEATPTEDRRCSSYRVTQRAADLASALMDRKAA